MRETEQSTRSRGIFDVLLHLPLIKGISQSRLQEIAGRMKLHFIKAAAGEVIVSPGQACVNLKFLLSGSLRLITTDSTRDFEVHQTLCAPQVIAPDALFGINTTYPSQVSALTDVSLMEVSKEDYRRMLALDPVFLFNYLNSVCSTAQRSQRGLMTIVAGSAAERLAYWVITLTQPGSTDIRLVSRNRDLHNLLGLTPNAWRSVTERLTQACIIDHVGARELHVASRNALAALLN